MTSHPGGLAQPTEPDRQQAARHADVALRSIGQPNSVAQEFDFWNDRYEGRRSVLRTAGDVLPVLVAVGGGMVSARFDGNAVPYTAKVVAPALMVAAIILFMGTVSGAHLNPAVSCAFALRGDFPWKRVPAYIVAQFLGAILATLLSATRPAFTASSRARRSRLVGVCLSEPDQGPGRRLRPRRGRRRWRCARPCGGALGPEWPHSKGGAHPHPVVEFGVR